MGGDSLMPWFKVDDTFHSHPKARTAGPAALGLWVMAGSYCAQYATDGVVPRWFVSQVPHGLRLARGLVEAELWSECGSGWAFHDWTDFQPSKDEIERDREANRARQKRFRESRRAARNAVTNAVTNAVSNGTPSRPVPTRPKVATQPSGSAHAILSGHGLDEDQRDAFLASLAEGSTKSPTGLVMWLHTHGELAERLDRWRTDVKASEAAKPGRHAGTGKPAFDVGVQEWWLSR